MEMTSWVFMWEDRDGERRWEAVQRSQTKGFVKKLIHEGVHPATIMVSYSPILFHWYFAEEFHNGLSDVNFHRIDEEIYGVAGERKGGHKPVDVPVEKKEEPKFGWIAPDGRFFGCCYGGHSHLAGEIVGQIQDIRDPERHLEDLGWGKVFSGSGTARRYSFGMGSEKQITDEQLRTLIALGIDDAYGVSAYLWKRSETK